jgi:hypothetical protein
MPDQSTWDLTTKWLAIYEVPDHGTSHQRNLSLVKPSPELALVSEHIKRKLEQIGTVELMTRSDIFPAIYQVQDSDGNAFQICLPILLDAPPRPFERIFEFVLPSKDP